MSKNNPFGRGDDAGSTLTELLVTMMVLGMVLAATVTLTIGFARTNAQNISRQDQIDTARVAVESMTKTLRTAVVPSQLSAACTGACVDLDAFLLGQDGAVQFYANVNNPGNAVGPSRVSYAIVTESAGVGRLVEKIQVPDSNVASGTGYAYCNAEAAGATTACKARLTTRTLAKGIQLGTGIAAFSYYDSSGTRMSPVSTGGSLSADALGKVLAVELVVTVQQQNATRADPTTYIQRITLPNSQAVMRQNEEN